VDIDRDEGFVSKALLDSDFDCEEKDDSREDTVDRVLSLSLLLLDVVLLLLELVVLVLLVEVMSVVVVVVALMVVPVVIIFSAGVDLLPFIFFEFVFVGVEEVDSTVSP
jgi:uncharacterized membrane protein